MNIKDIETEAPKEGDKLANIFRRQLELAEKYEEIEKANGFSGWGGFPLDIHDSIGQARIRELIRRVVEELFEASHTLKNSPWKSSHVLTDTDHFYEEISDGFHFFIELCIAVGMTHQDLYEVYFKKSEVNRFRQESNY